MRPVLICLVALSACTGGVGEPGSVLWQMTANDTEKRYHTTGDETIARMQCAQGGYEGQGFDACVANSMKY